MDVIRQLGLLGWEMCAIHILEAAEPAEKELWEYWFRRRITS